VLSRVRLPIRFDPVPLQRDVAGLAAQEWVPHFNTGCYDGDWSGVALRSVGGLATQLYPDPTAQGAYADTPTLRRAPAIAAALRHIRCALLAVRLLRLGPGALIREHRDYRLGYEDGEVRLHVPVCTSDRVEFVHAGERVDMSLGEVWYLDLNLPHSVINRSDEARVHLVVDCVVNEWLDEQLRSAPSAAA